jgi:hypothetical protein
VSNVLEESDVDAPAIYDIDWERDLIVDAQRETAFEANQVVRAQIDTGWYYRCVSAGRTSRNYPLLWGREEGQQTVDGSLLWEAVHPDDATVPTVTSAVWTIEDGLTLDSQLEVVRKTQITVSGGEAGVSYECSCRMTASDGRVIEQTIVIPRVQA